MSQVPTNVNNLVKIYACAADMVVDQGLTLREALTKAYVEVVGLTPNAADVEGLVNVANAAASVAVVVFHQAKG